MAPSLSKAWPEYRVGKRRKDCCRFECEFTGDRASVGCGLAGHGLPFDRRARRILRSWQSAGRPGQRRYNADESDAGPYPIPDGAPIEGGASSTGDRHVLVVDTAAWKLYELFDAHPLNGGTSWSAGSGAVFGGDFDDARPRPRSANDALPFSKHAACRHRRVFAGGLTITDAEHERALERLRGRRLGREVEFETRPLERYDALIPA